MPASGRATIKMRIRIVALQIAPMLTTTELAKDFREEFKGEFDQYFRDASQYAACLDAERARIFEEMQFTAQRYARFLNDSENWGTSE